jgi:hypothetical protein
MSSCLMSSFLSLVGAEKHKVYVLFLPSMEKHGVRAVKPG